MKNPRQHLRDYDPRKLDPTTLRHVRSFAQANLAEHVRIRAEFGDEETAVREWDEVFADDLRDNREAVEIVDAELARRLLK